MKTGIEDGQGRKWQLTINNPLNQEIPFTHDFIKALLTTQKSILYYCLCDEIGEEGTPHTHVYAHYKSAMRFSTLKKLFPTAHFELAKGTSIENRDYIKKEGKWAKSDKKDTNLSETFEEWGECPQEQQGTRNDLNLLYDLINQGHSNFEIISSYPEYLLNIDKIDKVRQTISQEKYKSVFRHLEVVYIYGKTGTGKTRGVMEKHGYSNVYRVTDYLHPFDSYEGQDIILFEEFRSSLKLHDMLTLLDGYPLVLPCRYANRQACYTKVYLCTNEPLTSQYVSIQRDYVETWLAFLRRIKKVLYYDGKSVIESDPNFHPSEDINLDEIFA